jgi:hypothetical protein
MEEIFLIQGKYTLNILKRFDMMDCSAKSTPMETNMKLLVDTSCYSIQIDDWFIDVSNEH